jgi:NTP pyrophosphatase (non-canonical NTP hydrolase)
LELILPESQKNDATPVILPIREPEPEPVILPFTRIGISPSPAVEPFRATEPAKAEPQVIQSGSKFGKTFGGSNRIDASASAFLVTPPPAPPVILGMDGEPADKLSWPKYLAWRKTKCRPYDYANGPQYAVSATKLQEDALHEREISRRALEEIDQAIHEFVGEVAELGELLSETGPNAFYESRDKLIDEIGDILFCGAWVLDAWGNNPLSDAGEDDGVEILDVSQIENIAMMAHVISEHTLEEITGHHLFMNALRDGTLRLFLVASVQAGLLCNSYKKLRFQRREQDVAKQTERVANVFAVVSQILGIASASVEDALRTNMRKLDARFPQGYQPGVGGGIRTGEGK